MPIEWGVQLSDTFSIDSDESYFADEVHLNRAATEAFTAYLAGLLNDHIATHPIEYHDSTGLVRRRCTLMALWTVKTCSM